MAEFQTPIDVANRALQHCGANMLDSVLGFSEISEQARATSFVYGKVRRAELQRNVWRTATRRAILRAIDTNTMLLSPSMWDVATTYFVGSIVTDAWGNLWISRLPGNTGYQPGVIWSAWEPYFGPLTVMLYDSTTSYSAGELVYVAVGDGTYRVYLSLQNGNSDVPGTATAWDGTVTYFQNQVATFSAVTYMSLVDLNLNNQPNTSPTQWTTTFIGGTGSDKWLQIGGAEFPAGVILAQLNIIYPINSGPQSQTFTNNVFRLPNGFLKQAPSDPKSGMRWSLGGPHGSWQDDWLFEGNYIVSSDVGPIMIRFVADCADVSTMGDMFCEMLACRIALEVVERLTQSTSKLDAIAKIYEKFATEARRTNAIEIGSEDPPDDDFVLVRY